MISSRLKDLFIEECSFSNDQECRSLPCLTMGYGLKSILDRSLLDDFEICKPNFSLFNYYQNRSHIRIKTFWKEILSYNMIKSWWLMSKWSNRINNITTFHQNYGISDTLLKIFSLKLLFCFSLNIFLTILFALLYNTICYFAFLTAYYLFTGDSLNGSIWLHPFLKIISNWWTCLYWFL